MTTSCWMQWTLIPKIWRTMIGKTSTSATHPTLSLTEWVNSQRNSLNHNKKGRAPRDGPEKQDVWQCVIVVKSTSTYTIAFTLYSCVPYPLLLPRILINTYIHTHYYARNQMVFDFLDEMLLCSFWEWGTIEMLLLRHRNY